MLVYRSFVVGLLGTIALLVAMLPAELRARRPDAVLTVAQGVRLDELPVLLGQDVVAVDARLSDGRTVAVYWSVMPRLAQ